MALLHVTPLYAGDVTTVNPSLTTAFTVPAGYRYTVKTVTMRNAWSGGSNDFYIIQGSVHLAHFILGNGGGSLDSAQFNTWVVFGPGAQLKLAVSNAAGVHATVSGYLYTI